MRSVGNKGSQRTEPSATRIAKGFVTIHWDQVLQALRRPTCRSGFGLIGGGLSGFAWPHFPQFQGSTLFAVMFSYGIIRVAAVLGSRADLRRNGTVGASQRRERGIRIAGAAVLHTEAGQSPGSYDPRARAAGLTHDQVADVAPTRA